MNKNGVNWDAELEYIKQVDAKAPTESKALCQCDRDWTDGGRLCQECGLERPATESKAEGDKLATCPQCKATSDMEAQMKCNSGCGHYCPMEPYAHWPTQAVYNAGEKVLDDEPPQPSVQGEQDDNNTDAHLSCRRIVAELMDRVTELEKSAPSITSARIEEIADDEETEYLNMAERQPGERMVFDAIQRGIEQALREAGVRVG